MPVMPGGNVFDNEGKQKQSPMTGLTNMMRQGQQPMQPGVPLQPGQVVPGQQVPGGMVQPGQQPQQHAGLGGMFASLMRRLADPLQEGPQQPRVGQPVPGQQVPGGMMVQPGQVVPGQQVPGGMVQPGQQNVVAGSGMVRPQSPPINMGSPDMSMRSPYTVHLMPEYQPPPPQQEMLPQPVQVQQQQAGGLMARFGRTSLGQRLGFRQQQEEAAIVPEEASIAYQQQPPRPQVEYGAGSANVQQFQPVFGSEQYGEQPAAVNTVYGAQTVQMPSIPGQVQEPQQTRQRKIAEPVREGNGFGIDYDLSAAPDRRERLAAAYQRYVLMGFDVEGNEGRFVVHGRIGATGETIPFGNWDEAKVAHQTYYLGTQ